MDVDAGDNNSNASNAYFKFEGAHQQEWEDNKKSNLI